MGETTMFRSFMQMFLAIIVVFGALFALRHYMLRGTLGARGGLEGKAPRLLTVRDRLQLGPRSHAYVIQAGAEVFLVCTTDNAVQMTPLIDISPVDPVSVEKTQFAASLVAAYEHLRQGRRE